MEYSEPEPKYLSFVFQDLILKPILVKRTNCTYFVGRCAWGCWKLTEAISVSDILTYNAEKIIITNAVVESNWNLLKIVLYLPKLWCVGFFKHKWFSSESVVRIKHIRTAIISSMKETVRSYWDSLRTRYFTRLDGIASVDGITLLCFSPLLKFR